MSVKWSVHNGILCIEENNKSIITPTAREIFAAVSGTELELKKKYPGLPDPISQLPDLRFSRIGSKIGISVNYDLVKIRIRLFIRRNQKIIELPFETRTIPDHIIIDNTWIYLSENYDAVIELLNELSIDHFNEITIPQYLRLARYNVPSDIEIIDNAKDSINKHPSVDYCQNSHLKADLYPYQKTGVSWLKFITDNKSGCIIGDEMGLGKTLQIIALITERKEKTNRPSLIISPASLLENWLREFNKFTNGMNVFIHHGTKRTGYYKDLLNYDVVITSYGLASSDLSMFRMINWDLVILDEAQNIKSPDATRTKSVKSINCLSPIAVTGTPFENHILDIWSILDYVSHGILGSRTDFENHYTDDIDGAENVESILTPLMLRRTVSDVAMDLPEKIVIPVVLNMTDREIHEYEEIRQSIVDEYPGRAATLVSLTKLRMYCTHPSLIGADYSKSVYDVSSKYQYVCSILSESIAYGEKILIFTSYNEMFDLFEHDLKRRFDAPVFKINGSTPVKKRQGVIDEFSAVTGPSIMILNPRAAGTGLNITAASRVIHFTPEWNPSLEDQASARAYRRGQKHTVFIYRLFYKDTVEEIIQERIEKKRDMFSAAVKGIKYISDDKEDIMRALEISPAGKE